MGWSSKHQRARGYGRVERGGWVTWQLPSLLSNLRPSIETNLGEWITAK